MNTVNSFFDKQHRLIMVLILLFISLYYLTLITKAPTNVCGPDGKTYEKLARRSSESSSLFSKGNFHGGFWSPAWVVSVAVLYRNVGQNPVAIRIGLIYFALFGGYMIYLIARQISGPLAGLSAALIFLLSDHIKIFITYYQYEIPSTVLLLAVVYVLVFWKPGKRWDLWDQKPVSMLVVSGLYLLLGLVTGWTILMSPRVLLLVSMAIACLWVKNSRRQFAIKFAMFVLGVLFVLTPWTVRNYRYYGNFNPVTTNGGINLYIGNNEYTTNGYFMPKKGVRPAFPINESRVWTKIALKYMVSHPVTTLKRFATRFYLFWKPEFRYQGYVLVGFLVGMVRVWLSRKKFKSQAYWLLGAPLFMSFFHMTFFHQWRYIIIVWPYICILAVIGIFGVNQHEKHQDWQFESLAITRM